MAVPGLAVFVCLAVPLSASDAASAQVSEAPAVESGGGAGCVGGLRGAVARAIESQQVASNIPRQRADDLSLRGSLLQGADDGQETASGCVCETACEDSFNVDCSAQQICTVTGPEDCTLGRPYWDLLRGYYDYCVYGALATEQATAEAKQKALLAELMANADSGPFYSDVMIAAGVYAESMIVTMETERDVFPYEGRKKYIRPVGVVAPARFVSTATHPYTGVFNGSDHVIIRLSLSQEPSSSNGVAPGVALKFFRDGAPSANLLGFTSFTGQPCSETNFFEHAMSNHVPPATGLAKLIPAKQQQGSMCTQMLGLSDAAAEADGSDPVFPFEVTFEGIPEVSFPCDDLARGWANFAELPAGTSLVRVSARPGPGEALQPIGEVIIDAPLTTSQFGDERLFFRHQRMEDDFAIHPEWLQKIDAKQDCGNAEVTSTPPAAANGCHSLFGIAPASDTMTCPVESPNSESFEADPPRGPTCETLHPEVKDNTDSLLLGVPALVMKRNQLQSFNRPVVNEWNTSALPPAEAQLDRANVLLGFRPYAGQYMRAEQPLMGSLYQEFTNSTPGGNATALAASPAEVAEALMHSGESPRLCSPELNQWFAVWVQLNTEDWVTGLSLGEAGPHGPNFATHWWDLSSTYGSRFETVQSHRLGHDGLLDVAAVANQSSRGVWIGLNALRYAFASEHNLIARRLAEEYPDMAGDDERLFNTARLILAAEVARIHTVEWTTLLLPATATSAGQETLWSGFLNVLVPLPSGVRELLRDLTKDLFDTETSNLLFGIAGGFMQDTYDFAWSEEFSLVYRMHTLLPDGLNISGTFFPLAELLNESSPFSWEEVAKGINEAPTCALAARNFPQALTELPASDGSQFDLAEHDIIATRARGITSFNNLRRALHLDSAKSFEDLVTGGAEPTARDAEVIASLEATYGTVEDVDALVGLMAEPRLPNAVLGITTYLVFVLMTQTRLESDPFYTEWFTKEYYTDFGLSWVEEREFADLLQDHLGIPKREGKSGFLF